jgi:hypothetical protein
VNRLHALVVSLVLGAAGVVGAIAATQTMQLGAASAAPAQMDRTAVRARAQRLNKWAKALNSTLAKRPPALPQVPQFGPIAVASYSTAIPVVARTAVPTARPTRTAKPKRRPTRSVLPATKASRSASTAPGPKPPSDEPPATEPPTTPTTTTTTTTVPAAPAAAPAPPPVPTSPPPTHQGGSGGGSGEPQDPPEPGDG